MSLIPINPLKDGNVVVLVARPSKPRSASAFWVVLGLMGLLLAAALVAGGVLLWPAVEPEPIDLLNPSPRPAPQIPDGYANEVLGFFDNGTGGRPGPYGRNASGAHPEPVKTSIVLGPPPRGQLVSWNRETRWLSLPAGSYVILGFRDEEVKDRPGPDLIIHTLDPADSAGEQADVFVSSDGSNFVLLERITQGGAIALDLAKIKFTGTAKAVKIVGRDSMGTSPGSTSSPCRPPAHVPVVSSRSPTVNR
jgi:hypothetical protein